MASIRKRGSSWRVQVRRSGQPPITRSFNKKSDAIVWTRRVEQEIDRRGLAPNRGDLERITLGDLLRRYRDEVVILKHSRERETHIIKVLLRHRMSAFALSHVTPDVFRRFRDERLATVKPATVRRQLSILQHAFNVAIGEWGLPMYQNPVAVISKPSIAVQKNVGFSRETSTS